MGAFDPASFLNASFDAPLVKRPPIAVGEYTGVIGEPVVRPWVSPTDKSKSGIAVDYQIELSIPEGEQQRIGLDLPTLKIKHGIMVDTTPTGGMDSAPGKNAGVRRLREALDMNKPGDSFNFYKAQGRPVKVKIGHREYPEGSGDLYEEVLGLARV